MANLIELKNISKAYGDNVILNHFNMEVKKNEFLTLLGPSGCGKTTTLRVIGGFESPDEGQVLFEGKDITDKEAYERPINTVFQRYALFPHLNVYENIAFGLKIKKIEKKEIDRRVKEVLELVNLSHYENREIESLSGGQQQRIAIARALVNRPKLILLDEPLGALDLKLRQGMQVELKKIQEEVGITFIYVTHDQEEALSMSDKIIVLNEGEIQQVGSPIEIYNEPKNAFVADFIGESNILEGIMHEDFKVEFSNHVFDCVDQGFAPQENVEVVIRPEDVLLVEQGGQIKGLVKSEIFRGVHYEMIVEVQGKDWIVQSTVNKPVGSHVQLYIAPDLIHVMKVRS
ncbi:MAG: ABC transporter ATP-binding protein [Tissierellia bacterium]|nr:ABC transporter ATP-binding protein [Tissierellia bacterium]